MKLLIYTFVALSLFFLFGGLTAIGLSNYSSVSQKKSNILTGGYEGYENILSINQIDSVTSNNNYYFTSANAKGISVNSVIR
jgi:hypothetical protein